jgi:NADH:ubiquinone oxidoreductase subunit F (NADH-binding)
MGVPLATLLAAAGGVVGRLKAIIVGGLSVPILTASEAEGLIMDYDTCLKHGTMLGSGGIMVKNEDTSIPQVARRRFGSMLTNPAASVRRVGKFRIRLPFCWTSFERSWDDRRHRFGVAALSDDQRDDSLSDWRRFLRPIEAMVTKFRSEFEALVR